MDENMRFESFLKAVWDEQTAVGKLAMGMQIDHIQVTPLATPGEVKAIVHGPTNVLAHELRWRIDIHPSDYAMLRRGKLTGTFVFFNDALFGIPVRTWRDVLVESLGS